MSKLEIVDLHVSVETQDGPKPILKGVNLTINDGEILKSMKYGFLNATDVADYLAKKGIPFRNAHKIVGEIVSSCEDKKIAIDDMTLEDFKNFSPVFESDITEIIKTENCVNERKSFGGTSKDNVLMQIKNGNNFLESLTF